MPRSHFRISDSKIRLLYHRLLNEPMTQRAILLELGYSPKTNIEVPLLRFEFLGYPLYEDGGMIGAIETSSNAKNKES